MMKKKQRFQPLLVVWAFVISVIVYLSINIVPFQYKVLRKKISKAKTELDFNEYDSLKKWEEKIFKRKVLYSVIKDRSEGYLNAYSYQAASGLVYWIKFNPKDEPMVGWKWKVVKFPDKEGGVQVQSPWIEKDDFAARFYIIFPSFPFLSFKCLEYVWDDSLPKDTVLTNPKFKNLKIIVAESGVDNLGKWVDVERNIHEDFKKNFGSQPPNAGAIAIMTDSENTLSTAEAQYDQIRIGYEK